jgi:hypothetical protein
MSEHTPEVRIAAGPPGSEAAGPPYNLEIKGGGHWVSLGILGTVTFGGPLAEVRTAEYRAKVTQVTKLLLAAPVLLAVLEGILDCPHYSGDHLRGYCAVCEDDAYAAIKGAREPAAC